MDGQSKHNHGKPMQSLYNFTKEYVKQKGYSLKPILPVLHKYQFLSSDGLYTGLAPYNNFHVSRLDLWNHPLIKEYIEEIQNINGCLMNFWMDANIHAMIIFVLCPLAKLKTYLKMDFGYRHNQHFSIKNSPNYRYRSDVDFYPLHDFVQK